MRRPLCPICSCRRIKEHLNSKYCKSCADQKRKSPASNLTKNQARSVKALVGKISQKEIMERLKISKCSLQRFAKEQGFTYRIPRYSKDTIEKVVSYYVQHGKIKTEKKFPNVRIRSIVERYIHEPRQAPWKTSELIDLVKMGGIVSMSSQAQYFNRPNAFRGSIQAAWSKKFKCSGGHINGLSFSVGKHFVRPICPVVQTEFWRQNSDRKKGGSWSRTLILWVDMERHLKDDVPEHIKDGIKALARFQRWLHGKNVHKKVEEMLERESYDNKQSNS